MCLSPSTSPSFPELSDCFQFGCFLFPQCLLAACPLDTDCAGRAALAPSQDSMGGARHLLAGLLGEASLHALLGQHGQCWRLLVSPVVAACAHLWTL